MPVGLFFIARLSCMQYQQYRQNKACFYYCLSGSGKNLDNFQNYKNMSDVWREKGKS